MQKESPKKDSLRLQKLASQFRHEIARLLVEDIFDEHLQQVTINHVKLTADLHICRVYFTSREGKENLPAILRAFRKCKGFLRSELAHSIRLKFTPELDFYYDDTEDMFNSVKDIFAKLDAEKSVVSENSDED